MNRYYRNVLSMLVAILVLTVIIAILFPKEKQIGNVSVDDYIILDIHRTNYQEYQKEQEIIRQRELELLEQKKKSEQKLASRSMEERKRQVYSTDLKVKSNFTVEQLENGLIGDSKKYAKYFIKAEQKYGINALILASISAQESGYMSSNMAKNKNNVFGFGNKRFGSKSECIDYVANFLNDEYLSEDGRFYHGTELKDVNIHYCLKDGSTDYDWSKKIKQISKDIYKRAME